MSQNRNRGENDDVTMNFDLKKQASLWVEFLRGGRMSALQKDVLRKNLPPLPQRTAIPR